MSVLIPEKEMCVKKRIAWTTREDSTNGHHFARNSCINNMDRGNIE